MTSGQIKDLIATAAADSDALKNFCVTHFGCGALVIVDWFGSQGAPSETEAPYVFLYSTGDSPTGEVEERSYRFVIECGGICDTISSVRKIRGADSNGLVINGCADVLEEMRDIVLGIAAESAASVGLGVRELSRRESSTLNYPLEWAAADVEVYSPQTL